MFGYVVPHRKELKICELAEYRSHYCGLCHCLGKQYGLLGKLSLSYDFTFLEILLTALYEPEMTEQKIWCLFHPLRRQLVYRSSITRYAADMNLLFCYYKCLDDWQDGRKWMRYLYAKLLRLRGRRLAKRYPSKVKRIQKLLGRLRQMELECEENIDVVSGCFGEVCRCIFVYNPEDVWSGILGTVGFYLGKFIYLLDAYEDMEQDMQANSYNVLLRYYQTMEQNAFHVWVEDSLRITIAQAGRAFEKLPVVEHTGILRNIIYAGVWERFVQITERKNNTQGRPAGRK